MDCCAAIVWALSLDSTGLAIDKVVSEVFSVWIELVALFYDLLATPLLNSCHYHVECRKRVDQRIAKRLAGAKMPTGVKWIYCESIMEKLGGHTQIAAAAASFLTDSEKRKGKPRQNGNQSNQAQLQRGVKTKRKQHCIVP